MEFLRPILELLSRLEPAVKAIAFVATIALPSIGWLRKTLKQRRIRRLLEGEEDELWTSRSPGPPRGHDSALDNCWTRSILVANLKGGVGKSTLTANLAAYFDLERGRRVLVVDCDYQGSVSGMLTTAADINDVDSRAEAFLSDRPTETTLREAMIHLRPILPNTWLVPAAAGLARFENRMMVQWVMDGGSDIRYRMFEALRACGAIKMKEHDNGFDVILFDAPPRLTTGTVNALATSTHLLVPTAMTTVSARSVSPFLFLAKKLRNELNRNLKLAGVVPTLTNPNGSLSGPENQVRNTIVADAVAKWGEGGHIFDVPIPKRAALAGSADGMLGYFAEDKANIPASEIVRRFGDALSRRIGLP